MRRMGCSIFWAATLFTTVAHPGASQTAEKSNIWGGQPYPIRKDVVPPVGLTPPAAAYTGIAPGALSSPVEPRKEVRPPALGPVVPVWVVPPLYGPSLPDLSGPFNPVKSLVAPSGVPSVPSAPALVEPSSVIAGELERLSAEVNRLRDSPAPSIPPPLPNQAHQAPALPEPPSPGAPLILILQNGQRLKLQSYAVINQTVWDFSAQPARSIPVSSINVTASQRATEAVGGEFPELHPNVLPQ